ncbi:MAG: hypothetical protein GX126_11390 [Bacteroidales bacterium]|jgi:hypothetical protein|nr:hypothetical protein [Bacteroidales bacterium]
MTETGVIRKYTTDEVIAHLVQAEWDERYNRKLQRLVVYSGIIDSSFRIIDPSAESNNPEGRS